MRLILISNVTKNTGVKQTLMLAGHHYIYLQKNKNIRDKNDCQYPIVNLKFILISILNFHRKSVPRIK